MRELVSTIDIRPQQRLSVIRILIILLVGEIYFSMHYHQWFADFFYSFFAIVGIKKMVKVNIIFIILLFYIYTIDQLILIKKGKASWINISSDTKLFFPVLFYTISALVIVIIHEEGFDAIKRYLIYLFTPVMVGLSIWGLYRKNNFIEITLKILFILGVIFSLYTVALHIILWNGDADDVVNISTIYGSPDYDIAYLERFTIPNMPPNMLQSILVPLILTGFYFNRNSRGNLRYIYVGAILFLFFSVIITASRGALISLMAGMLYLIWKGWFRLNKETIFFVLLLVFVVFIGGELLLYRVEWMIENYSMALTEWNIDIAEHRWRMLYDSFESYIFKNPIYGSGFTYFDTAMGSHFGFGDHNLYSILLAQGGVLVFIPFIFILALLYFNSRKILSRNMFSDPPSRDMGIVLNAGLIAYMVDLNFPPGFFHYYWIWFGFAAAWARNCEMEFQAQAKVSGAGTTQV